MTEPMLTQDQFEGFLRYRLTYPPAIQALIDYVEAISEAFNQDHLPDSAPPRLQSVEDLKRWLESNERIAADINAAMEIVPLAGSKSIADGVAHWAGQLDKARDDWRQMKAERDEALALVKKGVAAVEAMIKARDEAIARADQAASQLRWIFGATKEAIIRDAALKGLPS